jgi:hypothetical protein
LSAHTAKSNKIFLHLKRGIWNKLQFYQKEGIKIFAATGANEKGSGCCNRKMRQLTRSKRKFLCCFHLAIATAIHRKGGN